MQNIPDRWFTQEQIDRLKYLMSQWRTARNHDTDLPVDEQAELESLLEAELLASALRTKDLTDQTLTSNS